MTALPGVVATTGIASRMTSVFPMTLSPQLWLDASATSTIISSGGLVSEWKDRSGNGRHMLQSTEANRPTTGASTQNSKNVITFNGSSTFMTYDAGSDLVDLSPMVFAVVVYDNNSTQNSNTWRRVVNGRRSATGSADFQSPNFTINKRNTERTMQNNSNALASQVGYTNEQAMIFSGISTGSSSSIAANGNSLTTVNGNATIGNMRYLRVGAFSSSSGNPPATGGEDFWSGWIAEIILVNSSSTTDRTDLRDYLNTKWAVY
jgi:hypothetical protein